MESLKFPISCEARMALLLRLLDDAVALASEFRGGWSNNFFSAEEFCNGLSAALEHLRQGDTGILNSLWLWFAPTCDWDDFIGGDGVDLGQRIHDLIKLIQDECLPREAA